MSRYRPRVDLLENRLVPAVTFSVLDLDGDGFANDLRITGDSSANRIILTDDPNNAVARLNLAIDANGDNDFLDAGDIAPRDVPEFDGVLLVVLGGGNDQIDYTVQGDYQAAHRHLIVNLGSGDDTFTFATGDADVTAGSDVTVEVYGGAGKDTAQVLFDGVDSSSVAVQLALGLGSDGTAADPCQVQFGAGDSGIDNDAAVSIDADLGSGNNVLDVALPAIGATEQASVDVHILGGDLAPQNDKVNLTLNGPVGNGATPTIVTVLAQLGGGDDSFNGRLNYDGFALHTASGIFLNVYGGAGNDVLGFGGLATSPTGTITVDSDSLLSAALHGGQGNDVIACNIFHQATNRLFELNGELRVALYGDDGTDKVTLKVNNTNASTGDYTLAVFAGNNDDQVEFSLSNPAGNAVGFGLRGKVLLDGGLGHDKLVNGNSAITLVRFFEA